MSRRVVVTGMGAITPIGLSVEEFWDGVKEGKLGFGEITRFDSSEYKAHMAAEVKGFVGKEYMDFKAAKRMELFSQYAVAAAREAIEDAGLDMTKEDPYRVGTAVGSGVGSLQAIEREYTKLVEKGPGRVNPIFVPLMISNMACGNVSIQFGLKGKTINDVTACATGTNNIGEAFRSIQYGEADVMVTGGTEVYARLQSQDSQHLPHFLRQRTLRNALCLLTRIEADSYSVKVQEWLYSRNLSMPRQEAQRSTRKLSDTDVPQMHTTSLPRLRMDRVLPAQC